MHGCKYCNPPYKIFDNGDRVMPPFSKNNWWGIMPHYSKRVGTIAKIEKCPNCGRKLSDEK